MSRSIANPFEIVLTFAKGAEDRPNDIPIRALSIRTYQISFPNSPFSKNRPNCGRMIVHMDPIADIEAVSVKFRAISAQQVCYLSGYEFLNMLSRTIIIGAI